MPWGTLPGLDGGVPYQGVPCWGYSTGGTLLGGTLPGLDGGYPARGTLLGGTPPGRVPPGRVPPGQGQDGGYPARGTLSGYLPGRVPPQPRSERGGYPVRTTEGVLSTRRTVCLLRSRRRTFLFHLILRLTNFIKLCMNNKAEITNKSVPQIKLLCKNLNNQECISVKGVPFNIIHRSQKHL